MINITPFQIILGPKTSKKLYDSHFWEKLTLQEVILFQIFCTSPRFIPDNVKKTNFKNFFGREIKSDEVLSQELLNELSEKKIILPSVEIVGRVIYFLVLDYLLNFWRDALQRQNIKSAQRSNDTYNHYLMSEGSENTNIDLFLSLLKQKLSEQLFGLPLNQSLELYVEYHPLGILAEIQSQLNNSIEFPVKYGCWIEKKEDEIIVTTKKGYDKDFEKVVFENFAVEEISLELL